MMLRPWLILGELLVPIPQAVLELFCNLDNPVAKQISKTLYFCE